MTDDKGERVMVQKLGILCVLWLGLLLGASSASAFGPVNSVGPSVGAERDLLPPVRAILPLPVHRHRGMLAADRSMRHR